MVTELIIIIIMVTQGRRHNPHSEGAWMIIAREAREKF